MVTQVKDSSSLLKSVVDNAPFPIGVYEGQLLTIILANQCMLDTWGKGNDVIGKSYREILPELTNQHIFEQLTGVLETGMPFHAKNQRVDLVINGVLKIHYSNYSFTPIHDPDGNVYAVMNTAAEVTDLNIARKQVIEGEQKLRVAVQSADLGAFECDINSGTYTASERFNEICSIDAVPSDHLLDNLIHKDDKMSWDEAYRAALESGQLDFETKIVKGDIIRYIHIKGAVLPDDDGMPTSIVGVVQDVTEQKLFAEKLRRLVKKRTRELKRSNEDLLQFAHVVSHDLKEPVRKIKMFNNLLKGELAPVLDERSQRYIDKVQHASDRLYLMIDGILSYSSLNDLGNPVEQVDISTVLDNILFDLELVVQQKQATITIDGTIPVIEGSPILLHQLFYNIINNALKFTKEDVMPIITIAAASTGTTITITITDNGIGIDAKFKEQIFNAFERLNSKSLYEGTGLGLSLCKKIVERHHGTITADGTEGEGARFTIVLPQKQPLKKGNPN